MQNETRTTLGVELDLGSLQGVLFVVTYLLMRLKFPTDVYGSVLWAMYVRGWGHPHWQCPTSTDLTAHRERNGSLFSDSSLHGVLSISFNYSSHSDSPGHCGNLFSSCRLSVHQQLRHSRSCRGTAISWIPGRVGWTLCLLYCQETVLFSSLTTPDSSQENACKCMSEWLTCKEQFIKLI